MIQHLLPQSVEPSVRAEQIRLLFVQNRSVQVLGILTAIITAITLWKVTDHFLITAWIILMITVYFMRLATTILFFRTHTNNPSTEIWVRRYIFWTFLAGASWGSLSFLLSPEWPAAYQVVLFVVYTGLIAGAFNANSSVFIAFPAFYLPIVVPLMIAMLRMKDEAFYALALLFVIYIALMYFSSLKFYNQLAYTLKLRFENESMTQELSLYNEKLTHLADIDGLTQLYNRRSLDRFMIAEWNRHYRNKQPLSLLFIDIDYFKQFNDVYGHEAGDKCLIHIAQILQKNAKRSSDIAARFGGEEFAIILPETSSTEAFKIAEKIVLCLEELSIPHTGSSTSDNVTMSIGVSTLIPQQPDNSELLLTSADKALYDAKGSGRNCVKQALSPEL
ncbi:MAG: diguanylate cyclase [Sulfuricurvum sp.]|nr:diguanylate cyclase [Sulfuricurvum sp.]